MKAAFCGVLLVWGVVFLVSAAACFTRAAKFSGETSDYFTTLGIYSVLMSFSCFAIGGFGMREVIIKDEERQQHREELQAELNKLKPKKPAEMKVATPPPPPPPPETKKSPPKKPEEWNHDVAYDEYVQSRKNINHRRK
jgi:hypothetical protein